MHGRCSQYVRKEKAKSVSPKHTFQSVKCPNKNMFWGCFTVSGPQVLVPVKGMMNSVKHINVFKAGAIPELWKLHKVSFNLTWFLAIL